MSVSLDCIIFGLQRFGGISNYWQCLLRFMQDRNMCGDLILPKHILFTGFDAKQVGAWHCRREALSPRLTRYLPVRTQRDSVFHTSYYRRPATRVDNYIVTVYDFIYERYRTGLPRWIHSHQKLASIRSADEVICISHSTRADVLKFCPEVDPARVHTVHLGVDFDVYFPEAQDTEGSDGRTVLFVGQRGGYKRFDLAVEAIRQSPKLLLSIVGPPLTPREQSMLVERLGLRWNFLGAVSSAQLRRLYSSAYAFVFPSDYEGFGLPVLEAMACGCPVVASSASSLPEVGGGAATYATQQLPEEYARALAALQDGSKRRSIAKAGLAHCRSFSWESTCTKTLAIYEGRASSVAPTASADRPVP
jgi:mannosyltransferase